jgi:hypothetical protein
MMGNSIAKIDVDAPGIYPTTMTKEEIKNFRTVIEALTTETGPEPQFGEESYKMTLAMIITIHTFMKNRVQSESDQMELAQIEYVTKPASVKYVRLRPLLNLLDKVLERLQPTE